MKKLFYNKQYIDTSDRKAVSKSLAQKLITGGKSVENFEKKLKKFLTVKHAITCINGTAALHLAYEAIKLKRKDVVIMPVINFISSYSMAKLYDAKIYFADVDKSTGQMTPKTLRDCIKKNKLKKIKAVICMYLGGYPENIEAFYKIKKQYKFLIIEDACHAFGASYISKNRRCKVGSCKHADLSTFSFHPVKSITTGEGGLVTTNNKKFSSIISKFKNHNIVREKNYWSYNIEKLGFNYRLSDLNCALGISQLKKIKYFISNRNRVNSFYRKELKEYSNYIEMPKYDSKNYSSFHLILANIKFKNLKGNKNDFLKYLNKKRIFPQYHYIPIIKFRLENKTVLSLNNFKGAKSFFDSTVSLPTFVNLSNKDLSKIVGIIKKFFLAKRLKKNDKN
tara:strand:+ start:487 stop:1668 length:1182 start_codon:yes stop_codon:yes gene_type:complete